MIRDRSDSDYDDDESDDDDYETSSDLGHHLPRLSSSSIPPRAAPSFLEDVADESARKLRALSLQPSDAANTSLISNSTTASRRRSLCPAGVPFAPTGPLSTTRTYETMMFESASVIRDPGVKKRSDYGYEPIVPDICFVKIWEESHSSSPDEECMEEEVEDESENEWDANKWGSCRKAAKCFFTQDMADVIWICLLLPGQHATLKLVQLKHIRVAKYGEDAQYYSPFKCGKVFELEAVGACSMDTLGILLVETKNGGLVAYSGPQKIEKVLVNGQLSPFLSER
jgi:hypothetical protein